MKYNIDISKILDKYLPANGVGTERELLRMNIHRDICDLINELTIPDVVVPKGTVCGYCNDTGWDSYPNHDTTLRPCPECQP